MSAALAEEKRALRLAMRDARAALGAEQREALTMLATDRLAALSVVSGIGKRAIAGTSPSPAS